MYYRLFYKFVLHTTHATTTNDRQKTSRYLKSHSTSVMYTARTAQHSNGVELFPGTCCNCYNRKQESGCRMKEVKRGWKLTATQYRTSGHGEWIFWCNYNYNTATTFLPAPCLMQLIEYSNICEQLLHAPSVKRTSSYCMQWDEAHASWVLGDSKCQWNYTKMFSDLRPVCIPASDWWCWAPGHVSAAGDGSP